MRWRVVNCGILNGECGMIISLTNTTNITNTTTHYLPATIDHIQLIITKLQKKMA